MPSLFDWLSAHAPQLRAALADPVSDQALAEAEAALGRKLPADYVAFLRHHDGQRFVAAEDGTGSLASLFDVFELLPARFALSEWRSMLDARVGHAGRHRVERSRAAVVQA